ncbi:YkvA family protein [uncultured Duncaniella sp.]|uniref:YkvA family protein n=1 Tax=uncultured Duncaniella sp. TaxID=2768039 RepID=UPI0025D4F4D1|nr:YkvA family protein [uncultured Duncaniella sp.]
MAFSRKYFLDNINRFKDAYDHTALMDKLKKYGRKAGLKVVYGVLILYYASLDKSISFKDRMMIMAALGYFVVPLDIIPDALFGGFVDDMAALTFVLKTVWHNLTPSVFDRARTKLEEWFGPVTQADTTIPGMEDNATATGMEENGL